MPPPPASYISDKEDAAGFDEEDEDLDIEAEEVSEELSVNGELPLPPQPQNLRPSTNQLSTNQLSTDQPSTDRPSTNQPSTNRPHRTNAAVYGPGYFWNLNNGS